MKRPLTQELWEKVSSVARTNSAFPPWVREMFSWPWEKVLTLSESESGNEVQQPIIEETTVTGSYLEFLEEQISLGARGPQWTEVLRGRLEALRKFENCQVLFVSLHRSEAVFYLRLLLPTLEVIHWELC